MKVVRIIALIAFVIAVVATGSGIVSGLAAIHILWLFIPLALIAAGFKMGRRNLLNAGFVGMGLLNMIASFTTNNSALLIVAIITLIIAWDLEAYAFRTAKIERHDGQALLIRKHLTTLIGIATASAILFAVATNVNLEINIYTAILLGLMLVFGLAQALSFLRQGDQ